MSLLFINVCDECDTSPPVTDDPFQGIDKRERRKLKEAGWRLGRTKTLCPMCNPKATSEQAAAFREVCRAELRAAMGQGT